jgi:hypothetical protein
MSSYNKCPFPYFGGKQYAAPQVWAALGDVEHFVDPFMGSLAVLLGRPHEVNRPKCSETVNDLDGFLCNAWRSIQLSPDATAEAASWPISEADLHARHAWLLKWRSERNLEMLMGDPSWHEPIAAGYWLWGQSCWIGSGWCSGEGPWIVESGRLVNKRQVEGAGISRKRPHIGDDGQGVNRPQLRDLGCGEPDWHPMTMPELREWFRYLSSRLRHVRILHGDWMRTLTSGASKTMLVRYCKGVAGIFLDPPYSAEAERAGCYSTESMTVANDVRAWCRDHGQDPQLRIVLAGFDVEHVELEAHGWTVVEWFKKGFLHGGMSRIAGDSGQQHRERLWLSPACLRPSTEMSTMDYLATLEEE